jgi:hypothetical protein
MKLVTIKPKKSTTISTRIIVSSVGIAIILGLSALSTGGMLLQPAAAAPKDDCEKSGGKWVVSGNVGFCFRPLKPDECKLQPVPAQDPCPGLIVVDPDTADEDLSLEEILDLAFDLADIDDVDGTEDGGGGDGGDGGDGSGDGGDGGTQDETNVSQRDSTQDRTQGETNVNQNIQSKVQRQVIEDDGTGGGGDIGGGTDG